MSGEASSGVQCVKPQLVMLASCIQLLVLYQCALRLIQTHARATGTAAEGGSSTGAPAICVGDVGECLAPGFSLIQPQLLTAVGGVNQGYLYLPVFLLLFLSFFLSATLPFK